MTNRLARTAGLVLVAAMLTILVGCSSKPKVLPQQTFWDSLTKLCGKAYPGRVIEDTTQSSTFRDRALTLHVAECKDDSVSLPLLIDGRQWATLVVRRDEDTLSLKHLHTSRTDGPPSGYGGSTRGTGTEYTQDFYADEYTIALQEEAEHSVWTIEIRSGAVLQYALRREGSDRRFRAAFDLTRGRPAPTATPARPGL